MPIANVRAARVAVMSAFKTVWDAQTPPVPVLLYDNVKGDTPDGDTAWARIQMRHIEAPQVTIGGTNGKRFRHIGSVFVQIFTPFGDGNKLGDILAQVAKGAFQGVETAPDAVLFRNARINEVGQDGSWFQTNVIANFEWDEIV